MRLLSPIAAIALLGLGCCGRFAVGDGVGIDALVTEVVDGDTLKVDSGSGVVSVRLFGVDAPEDDQPFGGDAQERLAELTLDKWVTVYPQRTRDRFGRVVARIEAEDINVGLTLVEEGLAWHYVKYSKDPALRDAQQLAFRTRTGLWIDPQPVEPWMWRDLGKARAAQANNLGNSPTPNEAILRQQYEAIRQQQLRIQQQAYLMQQQEAYLMQQQQEAYWMQQQRAFTQQGGADGYGQQMDNPYPQQQGPARQGNTRPNDFGFGNASGYGFGPR